MAINKKGEIQGVTLTKGNVDDRKPVPNLTKKLVGLLLGEALLHSKLGREQVEENHVASSKVGIPISVNLLIKQHLMSSS